MGQGVTTSNADEFVDFEDGEMPPAEWKAVTSITGAGTTVANASAAAHTGSRGMLSIDDSTTEASAQRAGIGLSSAGATATVLTDELRLTESQL